MTPGGDGSVANKIASRAQPSISLQPVHSANTKLL